MKGRNLLLLGISAVVLGIILILFRTSLASGKVVIVGGVLFVAAGLINMSVFLGSRDKEGKARMGAFGTAFGWLASAAAVILGVAMLVFSNAFVAITGFMFGVLILFAALFQMCLLIFGARPTNLSPWFYLVPTALVAAAIYIFTHVPEVDGSHTVMTVTGASFVLFGFFTIIEGTAIGQVNRQTVKSLANDVRLHEQETRETSATGTKAIQEPKNTPAETGTDTNGGDAI